MTRARPCEERDAAIVARVLDDQATLREVAREFGMTWQNVHRIVRGYERRLAAEANALDFEELALLVRYHQALELVDRSEPEERWNLLAAVVWPSAELEAVSIATACEHGAVARQPRSCSGCGVSYERGDDCYTDGCRTCTERRVGRRKRERDRAARTEAVA